MWLVPGAGKHAPGTVEVYLVRCERSRCGIDRPGTVQAHLVQYKNT